MPGDAPWARLPGIHPSILTRSPLVLPDLDVLKKFKWVRVGISITSVRTRQFEPGVPPLERRIETLARLSEAGIKTWVSLAPVIPGIAEVDIHKLFRDLSTAGVPSVSFGVLRFAGYEESRGLFEETAGMSASEALEGKEAMSSTLRGLVREYGMTPTGDMSWKPNAEDAPSLESFCR